MSKHASPSSEEAPQEDSTPFVNEQYFGSFIPHNRCGETPQHVDKLCHLTDPISTTDSLDQSSTLDAPDDHLLELDSTSLAFNFKTPLVLKLSLFL